jgi:ribosomal protein S18 acetylase RimI-like enzyme
VTVPSVVLAADLDAGALRGVEEIYDASFPVRQRMPFADIVASAAAGERLVVVLTEDGRPIGFGTVLPLRGLRTGYVEYVAVRDGWRDRGLGSTLWRELLDRAYRERGLAAVVFEVEDPAEADGAEAEERRRRIRFYERLGAVRLPVRGFLAVNLDDTGTEPMHLMWASAVPGAEPPRDDVGRLVRAVYVDGYELPVDSPLIAAAVASIG